MSFKNSNHIDMDNQTLCLPQDFYIGQRVTFRGQVGIITNIVDLKGVEYPVSVKFNDETHYFTLDGRYYSDGEICLFRLEESDKAANDSDTDDMDSIVAPSLQTFTDIAEWIAKTAKYENGKWIVGNLSLNTEELHLLYVIKGTDNTTKP